MSCRLAPAYQRATRLSLAAASKQWTESLDTTPMTRALWYVAPGQAILRAEAIPAPGSGEVLVQTRYSALSRGTESLVFQGAVPETEHRRMRAPFQAGVFPFPVKYGYAAAGTVTVGPRDLLGREVFALHPHQTAFVVPIEAVIALPRDCRCAARCSPPTWRRPLTPCGMPPSCRAAASR